MVSDGERDAARDIIRQMRELVLDYGEPNGLGLKADEMKIAFDDLLRRLVAVLDERDRSTEKLVRSLVVDTHVPHVVGIYPSR